MDDAQLVRFIQHFERITRHMLEDTPTHAHVVVRINAERRTLALEVRAANASAIALYERNGFVRFDERLVDERTANEIRLVRSLGERGATRG